MKLVKFLFLGIGVVFCLNLVLLSLSFHTNPTSLPRVNYFIAANYFNSEESLLYSLPQIEKLINYLYHDDNVFVSFFENGSQDTTKQLLADFQNRLRVPNSIVTCNLNATNNWGKDSILKETIAKKITIKNSAYRYRKMAQLRNIALEPLFTHKFKNQAPVKVVFLNDIFFKAEEILSLINTKNGDYDMVCPLDYFYLFYDVLATRDIEGYWFSGYYPYTRHKESQEALKKEEPFQVYSCWNGVAVMDAKPFTNHGVRFRGRNYQSTCECTQSECLLIAKDFREVGFNKIYINPSVKVSYEWKYYKLHNIPILSQLVNWWQSNWFELEKGRNQKGVGCSMPPYWEPESPSYYMNSTCSVPFNEKFPLRPWSSEDCDREQNYEVRAFERIKEVCDLY